MTKIPQKDVDLILDVADYVARNNPVKTYDTDDLRQEMFIYGMQSYSKWDESQHAHKNLSKRDKNLRIFLKDYMIKRVKNMHISLSRNKRAVNVNVLSFDQNDPMYEKLLVEDISNKMTEDDFVGLGLEDDEVKILMYISENGLATRKELVDSVGVGINRVNKLMWNLRRNEVLKGFLEKNLEDQVQPT